MASSLLNKLNSTSLEIGFFKLKASAAKRLKAIFCADTAFSSTSNLVFITGRFHRLGRCFIDWATAVVGEGDTCQLSVSFTYHSSGPI